MIGMSVRGWLGAAAVAAFLTAGQAQAEGKQDFTLVNKTGYTINEVYVSPVQSQEWEDDILGQDTLGNSQQVDIKFSRAVKSCTWDLKVVYDDGEAATWTNVDLCKLSKVTIRYNRNTGETTARGE